jgi:hypothetical protein
MHRLVGASCPFIAFSSYRQPYRWLPFDIPSYRSGGEKSRTAISASEYSTISAELKLVQNALTIDMAVESVILKLFPRIHPLYHIMTTCSPNIHFNITSQNWVSDYVL